MFRLLIVFALVPTAIYVSGCGADQPRVVEETPDQTFEDLADRAAEETERSEAQEH